MIDDIKQITSKCVIADLYKNIKGEVELTSPFYVIGVIRSLRSLDSSTALRSAQNDNETYWVFPKTVINVSPCHAELAEASSNKVAHHLSIGLLQAADNIIIVNSKR